MVMAQWRIKKWNDWEFWGDAEDGSESVDRLRSPLPIKNPALALVANWMYQFVKTVDPYTYISIRRCLFSATHECKWRSLVSEPGITVRSPCVLRVFASDWELTLRPNLVPKLTLEPDWGAQCKLTRPKHAQDAAFSGAA